jgi:hypothetical protein
MRNSDPRSRCIAILPDAVVNAHLLAHGDPQRAALEQAFVILERAGFGIVQLPPDDLPPEHARASIDFALDQIADYLKHGYRFLLLDPPGPAGWRSYLDQEIRRRAIAGIETLRLVPDRPGLQPLEARVAAIRESAMAASPASGD